MKGSFYSIDMPMLQAQRNTLFFEDKITLLDNLDERLPTRFSEVKDELKLAPLKFSTVIQGMFCLKGSIDIQVNFNRYHVTENEMLIITSKQIGELYRMSDDVRFAIIAISSKFYDPALNRTNSIKQQNLLAERPYHRLGDTEMKEIMAVYELLKCKIKQDNMPYKKEIIKGFVHAFFFNVFAILTTKEKTTTSGLRKVSRQQDIYKRFIDAVQEHYAQERNIRFYADILCITPKYLSQTVYKVSGHFASEHINELVVREVKALIKSQNYSMLQISEMLNFTSPSSFTRFFKKATGYTPLQYQDED
jgi:AraC-like DNA-binding protein